MKLTTLCAPANIKLATVCASSSMIRIGKKEKFTNAQVKEVHDVSTRVISQTKLSLHENVVGFDEDALLIISAKGQARPM